MDCCGEYRGQYAGGAGAGAPGWDYASYALPYAPYAHYYPDPYRYYRYEYPAHLHHNDHAMPMDYGSYASKEVRVRRALARRDARALTPTHHLPLTPTPPLECGMNGRGATYCEPHMWPHYQMGLGGGGWGNAGAMGGAWARAACSRDHMRYTPDCRPMKGNHMHQSQMCPPDGRSTPYPMYEESSYRGESGSRRTTPEYRAPPVAEAARPRQPERPPEPRRSPPEEPRPPVVPLPAFQQAFGSTEIGKFAEAFSRTEAAHDPDEAFVYDSFPEWDAPEPQWSSPPAREIKCEDTY